MSMAAMPDAIAERLVPEFENIFREYSDLVFGAAYGITGKREDAEDAVQTVFMRLLRRGLPADFHQNPRAYLYRAAINESLNTLRSRRRRPTTNLEHAETHASATPPNANDVEHRKLYEAMAELSPSDAEILILRYTQDCSDAEIARLLGKSRVAIAVRLHRARAQLKKLLRASLGEEL